MKLDDLKEDIAKGDMHYRGICHDCGVKVFVEATLGLDGAITISGGAIYKKKRGLEDIYFFKCDKCYKKDKTLRNWQECEVYSRVVGYLRPVQQWNPERRRRWICALNLQTLASRKNDRRNIYWIK